MCAPFDSRPPIPAIAGASVSHRHEALEADDCQRFEAFVALPDRPTESAGVVVLPDVRGLFPFYEEVAMRFAEQCHPAVAIDYFGRTAGVATRDADFPYTDHVPLTTPEQVQMDIASAVAFLRSPSGGACAATAGSPPRVGTGSWPPLASTACRASATASRARSMSSTRWRRRSSP